MTKAVEAMSFNYNREGEGVGGRAVGTSCRCRAEKPKAPSAMNHASTWDPCVTAECALGFSALQMLASR